MDRRKFLKTSAIALPGIALWPQTARPRIPDGVQIGDVTGDRAIIWARADRPSRLTVEYSTRESFADARRVSGPVATADSDFTARVDLQSLPADQRVFFRAAFEASDGRTVSEPVVGSLRTAPADRRDVRFLWSGDTVGQGWGINPDLGGMKIYESMRRLQPDFFIHSGDTIYSDSPIVAEVQVPGGAPWRNLVTEAKSKVAETLDEYRGNYRYNLMDENLRRFNSEVPQIWQWDDHEVINNWSPGKDLTADARYKEKDILKIAARARQAFLEYAPMRFGGGQPLIYRRIPYGPLVDVFVLDMRSYRAANSYNRQETENAETVFFGREQWQWLERDIRSSRAIWKIIASDMPIGLVVGDGRDAQNRPRYENPANGNGPALGRELEIVRLLKLLKENRARNVVWLTTDIHYTAAHFYDPEKAQFTDFDPFWEFVSGPLNAGTSGPAALDNTFGIQVMYQKAAAGNQQDRSPRAGLQFFGDVSIEGRTGALTVNLRDLTGASLFSKTLPPQG